MEEEIRQGSNYRLGAQMRDTDSDIYDEDEDNNGMEFKQNESINEIGGINDASHHITI